MYSAYIKRIIKVKIPLTSEISETPDEVLEKAKHTLEGEVISDTFLVEDENELIVAKQKVVYDGIGKVLREDHILK